MINKEQLDIEYKKYKELYLKIKNQKDMIDGCLNRIAVSDNEKEVERYYNCLINHSIKEYKDNARKAHKQWIIYDNLFNEYVKGKK